MSLSKITGKYLFFNTQHFKTGVGKVLELFLDAAGFLESTASGLRVKVNDAATSLSNLWTSQKTSTFVTTYVDTAISNALTGLLWKNPVINIIDQATLDGLTPSTNDRYLINDGANINKIAQYNGASWDYIVPAAGWSVTSLYTDYPYVYDAESTDAFKWVNAPIKQAERRKVDRITITATHITNKKVPLSFIPVSASDTRLFIIGGTEMDFDVDYTVNASAKELGWNTLGLDGVVEEGEKFVIEYSTIEK